MKASRASEYKSAIESHGKTVSATDFLITRVIRNRVTHLCGRVALVPSFWDHRLTNRAACGRVSSVLRSRRCSRHTEAVRDMDRDTSVPRGALLGTLFRLVPVVVGYIRASR